MKQTYNTQDEHKKLQKLNLTNQTNPGLVTFYDIGPEKGLGLL